MEHYGPPVNESGVRCLQCGYNLTGAALGGRCPECGTPVGYSLQSNLPGSPKAVASMVLGIIAIPLAVGGCCYGITSFFSLILGPLAIIFARGANNEIAQGMVNAKTAGAARAGMICGIIGTVLGAIMTGGWVLLILFAIAS